MCGHHENAHGIVESLVYGSCESGIGEPSGDSPSSAHEAARY